MRVTEEEGHGEAVVALHCERGCPGGNRKSIMIALAGRIQSACVELPEGASPILVRGVKDCTVVESRFAFSVSDKSDLKLVMDRVEDDLKQLQRILTPHIDAAIEDIVSGDV